MASINESKILQHDPSRPHISELPDYLKVRLSHNTFNKSFLERETGQRGYGNKNSIYGIIIAKRAKLIAEAAHTDALNRLDGDKFEVNKYK